MSKMNSELKMYAQWLNDCTGQGEKKTLTPRKATGKETALTELQVSRLNEAAKNQSRAGDICFTWKLKDEPVKETVEETEAPKPKKSK